MTTKRGYHQSVTFNGSIYSIGKLYYRYKNIITLGLLFIKLSILYQFAISLIMNVYSLHSFLLLEQDLFGNPYVVMTDPSKYTSKPPLYFCVSRDGFYTERVEWDPYPPQ